MQLHPVPEAEGEAALASTLPPQVQALVASGRRVFLSINRFERKKVSSTPPVTGVSCTMQPTCLPCGSRQAAPCTLIALAHHVPQDQCACAAQSWLACSSKPKISIGQASLPPRPPADPQGCVQNVALAIRALEVALQKPASSSSPPRWPLLQRLTSQKAARSPTPGCCLVVAGGYDQRLPENREVLAELQALVQQLGVQEHVSLPASLVTEKCKSCSGTQCCLSSACGGSACSNVAGPCLPALVMVVPGQH